MSEKVRTEGRVLFPSSRYYKESKNLRRNIIILGLVWTTAILLVFSWHLWEEHENLLKTARIQASDSFEKDLIYRRWAANHGGVYVPATKETPP